LRLPIADCGDRDDEGRSRSLEALRRDDVTTRFKENVMRCSFCGCEFDEEEGAKTCGACAAFGGCRMVMCPRCGYEMPQESSLIKLIRRWRNAKNVAAR